jgi:hypothetical protein
VTTAIFSNEDGTARGGSFFSVAKTTPPLAIFVVETKKKKKKKKKKSFHERNKTQLNKSTTHLHLTPKAVAPACTARKACSICTNLPLGANVVNE